MKQILFFIFFLFLSIFSKANFTRDSLFISGCYNDYGDTTFTIPDTRFQNIYDNNNFLIQTLTLSQTGVTWTDSLRDSYSRDVNGRIIIHKKEIFSAATWRNLTLDSFLYSASGKYLLTSNYNWTSFWQPVNSRSIYKLLTGDLDPKMLKTLSEQRGEIIIQKYITGI